MKKKFLELWPSIKSDFEWRNDAYEEHTLDDDFSFTGRHIAAYSFMGSRFTAKTWVDMICGMLSMVYELDPVVFHKFVPGARISWEGISHGRKATIASKLVRVSTSILEAQLR